MFMVYKGFAYSSGHIGTACCFTSTTSCIHCANEPSLASTRRSSPSHPKHVSWKAFVRATNPTNIFYALVPPQTLDSTDNPSIRPGPGLRLACHTHIYREYAQELAYELGKKTTAKKHPQHVGHTLSNDSLFWKEASFLLAH